MRGNIVVIPIIITFNDPNNMKNNVISAQSIVFNTFHDKFDQFVLALMMKLCHKKNSGRNLHVYDNLKISLGFFTYSA